MTGGERGGGPRRRRRGGRRRLRGLLARVRDMVFRRAAERDMDEELRFHLEMETEKNLRAGMEPAEARRRALVAFGGAERHRERLREGRRVPIFEPLWNDVRFGLRSLARTPGLALVAALTIALGVGATTAVFSVVNALLLRPPPVPAAERVMTIQEERYGAVSTGIEGMKIPYSRYLAYRDATTEVFQGLAAYRLDNFALRLADATVPVDGALTSGDYFQVLGVRPLLGRAYTSDEAAEVVLSHDLWTSRFGGDREVLGRTVSVDGQRVTVVGVAPPGFRGVSPVSDALWVPSGVRGLDQNAWTMRVVPVGRLRDGVTRERAGLVVEGAGARIPLEESAQLRGSRLEPVGSPPSGVKGPVFGFMGMLLGMALLVLLIASANIAGVMLARGFARRREIAVRQAIGAGRTRLVRHLLAESLMVFAVGGAAGVALAWLGTSWIARIPLPPQVPLILELTPDGRVMGFAVLLTGLTGIVFGLVPALKASRPDLVPALKSGGHGAAGGSTRARDLFVAGQVAFAVLLLLTAGLFVRSFQRGASADLGFDPDGVVVATVNLGPPQDYSVEQARTFYATLVERVRRLPGVEDAALSQFVLLAGDRWGSQANRPDAPEAGSVSAAWDAVDPDFFRTMGVDLVAGRGFTERDAEGSPPVAVINQTLADRLWPGQSPIGHLVQGFTTEPLEVVGVARNGRYIFITETPGAFLFVPVAQAFRYSMALHVRAPGAEAATLRAVRDEVRRLDPDLALRNAAPMSEVIGLSLVPQRVAAQLVGTFGIVGLVLAALGIYGVLAFQVARRTKEFGIRRALGAGRAGVIRQVVRKGGWLAGVGCVLGMAAGGGIAMLLRSFLFGIQPLDPPTFVAVPVILLGVALLAAVIPAARASSVQASVALKEE